MTEVLRTNADATQPEMVTVFVEDFPAIGEGRIPKETWDAWVNRHKNDRDSNTRTARGAAIVKALRKSDVHNPSRGRWIDPEMIKLSDTTKQN